MVGSSPEEDSKPPARLYHLWQRHQQECDSKVDSESFTAVDQHPAIANLLSLQCRAQRINFAGAQQPREVSSTTYLYSADHASSILPKASTPQVHPFEEDAARIQAQRTILQQQLPLMLPPPRHLLQTPQPSRPYLGFVESELLLKQLQLQTQILTNHAFRDSQLVNQLGSTGQSGGLLDWYSNYVDPISSAVPYSGAAEAAADIASVLPNFKREQTFAETVRNQTAHLQRQNFAESDPVAKPKMPRAKAKQKEPKQKGQPKRPLSAYNIFFQEERAKILRQIPDKNLPKRRNNKNPNRSKPHGKITFEEMAKKIGPAWRNCPEEIKLHYKELAEKDTQRYLAEKEVWKSQQSAEMTQQQQLLQHQVDSKTMLEYIRHEEQQRRKVDGKTSRGSVSVSVSGQSESLLSLDDAQSKER